MHNAQLRIHRLLNYMICVRHCSRRGGALCRAYQALLAAFPAPAPAPGEPRTIPALPRAPPCGLGWARPRSPFLPCLWVTAMAKQSRCPPIFTLCHLLLALHVSDRIKRRMESSTVRISSLFYLLSSPRRTSRTRRKSSQRLFAGKIQVLSCFGGGSSTWEV